MHNNSDLLPYPAIWGASCLAFTASQQDCGKREAFLGSKSTWKIFIPLKTHFAPISITSSFRQRWLFYEYSEESHEFLFFTNPVRSLLLFRSRFLALQYECRTISPGDKTVRRTAGYFHYIISCQGRSAHFLPRCFVTQADKRKGCHLPSIV